MAIGGYLLDFYSMSYVDLEADYWNKTSVEELAINGVGYYAMSDYLIPDPSAIFFNKQMLADYQDLENPYTLVREGNWTLDKFFEMCSAVQYDNQGLDDPMLGLYGLAVMADADFIPLIDSCEISLLDDYDGVKVLNMSAGNDKYATLLDTVFEKMTEDWVYLYPLAADQDVVMNITNGTALFTMEKMNDAYKHRELEVKFGFLPYPKWSSEQEEYHSFNWGGMLCVPNTVRNMEMMEKTMEALSFFSTDTTKYAYYEKLLGSRLSGAPDDTEMLDYIWNGLTSNPVINYIDRAGTDLGKLVYTIADGVEGIMQNGKPGIDMASYFNRYKNGAQDIIDKVMNGKSD
jgi:hypothetical protein